MVETSLRLGARTPSRLYFGSREVHRLYRGRDTVWDTATPRGNGGGAPVVGDDHKFHDGWSLGPSSIALEAPDNRREGDLLIAVLAARTTEPPDSMLKSDASQFTRVGYHTATHGYYGQLQVWYRIAGPSEPAHYKWTVNNSRQYALLLFRVTSHGVGSSSNPLNDFMFAGNNSAKTAGSNHGPPSVDTSSLKNNTIIISAATINSWIRQEWTVPGTSIRTPPDQGGVAGLACAWHSGPNPAGVWSGANASYAVSSETRWTAMSLAIKGQ